jgi:hypothetical protein
MTTVLINPGSGAVQDSTLEQAQLNMNAFVAALGGEVVAERAPDADADRGRFTFELRCGKESVEVDMPGCSLELLRDSRSMFTPRLYVDGSSWYWPFALGVAARHLGLPKPETAL